MGEGCATFVTWLATTWSRVTTWFSKEDPEKLLARWGLRSWGRSSTWLAWLVSVLHRNSGGDAKIALN